MNEQKTKTVYVSTFSFGNLLQLTFIILKLCHVIDWSWFWVLSPTIFTLGLGLLIILICLIFAVIANAKTTRLDRASEKTKRKKRKRHADESTVAAHLDSTAPVFVLELTEEVLQDPQLCVLNKWFYDVNCELDTFYMVTPVKSENNDETHRTVKISSYDDYGKLICDRTVTLIAGETIEVKNNLTKKYELIFRTDGYECRLVFGKQEGGMRLVGGWWKATVRLI